MKPPCFYYVYTKRRPQKGISLKQNIKSLKRTTASVVAQNKKARNGPSTRGSLVTGPLHWSHSWQQRSSLTTDWHLNPSVRFRWHSEPSVSSGRGADVAMCLIQILCRRAGLLPGKRGAFLARHPQRGHILRQLLRSIIHIFIQRQRTKRPHKTFCLCRLVMCKYVNY